ncbi:MAG: acyl-CoA dehydrogenase family protein [Chloroflexi bacterium]|nr:acyl-CoA dehydrogenase family protein [Chloroflexota bacterium]
MEFTIPEELKLLQQTVRRFIAEELTPLERQGAPYEKQLELRKRARDLGLFMMHAPAEYGGGDVNTLGLALVYEEIGKTILPADFILGMDQPVNLMTFGTPEQIERYLRPAIRGERYWGFALSEPQSGSDAQGIETTAVRDGDEWVLNGRKLWISRMMVADFVVLFAVTDKQKRARGGISAFIFDKETPGFQVLRLLDTMNEDGIRGPTEILLENVRLPHTALLGREGDGFKLMQGRLGVQRTAMAARCIGMSEWALDQTIAYAKQRVTFGAPVADRQGIQWYFADAAVNIHATRLMTYHCAWKWDRGDDVRAEASVVKLFATEMCSKILDMAIQVHGGIGYTKELGLEKMYRYQRRMRIVEGPSEIHKNVIARSLLRAGKYNMPFS